MVVPHALAANSVEVVPADVVVAPPVDGYVHDALHIVVLAAAGEGLVSVDQAVVAQIHTHPSVVVNVAQVAADVSVQDVPDVAVVAEGDVAVVDHGSYATDVVPVGKDAVLSGVSILVKHGVGIDDAVGGSTVVRTHYCFSHDGMQASTAPAWLVTVAKTVHKLAVVAV